MTRPEPTQPEPTLRRVLGPGDAATVGLGAMVGSGVFVAVGPAAAGGAVAALAGLVVAGALAHANATSTAALAAVHPTSGGAYVYGRERLGPAWGHLAGWGFVVGKTASCAAMALTLGAYLWPAAARPVAVGAVVALTAIDAGGVARSARAVRIGLAVVLASLAVVVVAGLTGGVDPTRLTAGPGPTPRGVLAAAGMWFFAFAGYARIATLGEEVRDPARTIPRAVRTAVAVALAVYLAVAVTAVVTVDASRLAAAAAPLTLVVAGAPDGVRAAVRVGAVAGSAGVLLSLLAGVARTVLALARDGHLPRALARVDRARRVPLTAQLTVGATVAVVAAVADLRDAIGFSSFGVLTYYTVANLSALRLDASEGRPPRWLPVAGALGCVVVAASLPWRSVVGGLIVVGLGATSYAITARRARRRPDRRPAGSDPRPDHRSGRG